MPHTEDEVHWLLDRAGLSAGTTRAYLTHSVDISHTIFVMLQTEDMFRDPDAPVPESQRPDGELQRLVIERNLSSDQSEAPNVRSATNGEAEGMQMTVNAPALLDRPVPARANPMARFHEQSKHA